MRRAMLGPVLLCLAACGPSAGDGAGAVASASATDVVTPAPITGDLAVPRDRLVVVTTAGEVVVLDPASEGTAPQRLSTRPAGPGEAVSVDLSPDRTTLLVGRVDAAQGRCAARTDVVRADGSLSPVLDGARAAFSPDGARVAYVRYGPSGTSGACSQRELVVRDTTSGAQTVLADVTALAGTPPSWPVTWSPDGRRLAVAVDTAVRVVDVTGADDGWFVEDATAPVFTADGGLAVQTGCCTGEQPLRSVALVPGEEAEPGAPLVTVDRPVRSVRRAPTGGGLWLTLEEAGLWRWDGASASAAPVPGAEDATLVTP